MHLAVEERFQHCTHQSVTVAGRSGRSVEDRVEFRGIAASCVQQAWLRGVAPGSSKTARIFLHKEPRVGCPFDIAVDGGGHLRLNSQSFSTPVSACPSKRTFSFSRSRSWCPCATFLLTPSPPSSCVGSLTMGSCRSMSTGLERKLMRLMGAFRVVSSARSFPLLDAQVCIPFQFHSCTAPTAPPKAQSCMAQGHHQPPGLH